MANLAQQAESAVKNLLQADEGQLYEQLGIRAKALAEDPTQGSSFEPQVTYDVAQMGLKEDVREFGQRLFHRWNVETYKLICGSDPKDKEDREDLMNAFGVDDGAVAAALTALLITNLGLTPALAVVIAAITVKRFFRPAYQEFCRIWEKNLQQQE